MPKPDENAPKVHYICQTYVENKRGRDGQISLKIDKQFQYTSATQAEERAEREFKAEACVGADAYVITEDPSSDEVTEPSFMLRLGVVPEAE